MWSPMGVMSIEFINISLRVLDFRIRYSSRFQLKTLLVLLPGLLCDERLLRPQPMAFGVIADFSAADSAGDDWIAAGTA